MTALRCILVACFALTACNSTCGGQGQACCSNSMCNPLLACTGIAGNPQSFKCEPCGMIGAPCCGTQPQCVAGASCGMTVDTGPHCYANGDGGIPDGGGFPDAAGMQCAPSGGCTAGPSCGGVCCGAKEWCDTSGRDPVCRCGGGAACTGTAACVSNLGTAQCGFTCCPPTCPP